MFGVLGRQERIGTVATLPFDFPVVSGAGIGLPEAQDGFGVSVPHLQFEKMVVEVVDDRFRAS